MTAEGLDIVGSSLGVPHDRVVLVAYDPAWPALFEAERRRLVAAVGEFVLDIQHIGSTSVPGLAAKPIIDIGVAVRDFDEAKRCIAPMQNLGYIYRGEHGIPRRHFFYWGDPKHYHVHMNEIISADWRQTICFRDYLRRHPQHASDYAQLKELLAQQYAHNPVAYQEGKGGFIVNTLQKANCQGTTVDTAP